MKRPSSLNCLCFKNTVISIENARKTETSSNRFTKSPPTARSNDRMKIHCFFFQLNESVEETKICVTKKFGSNQNTHRHRYETVAIQIKQRSNDVW